MKMIPLDYVVKDVIPKNKGDTFRESERQMNLVNQYFEKEVGEIFFKLHYKALPLVIKLRDCFPLYFYMCDNVTRRKGKDIFWNQQVIPYYKNGFLPFAKHQNNIAEDLGISQSSVSVYLKILRENEVITRIGKEFYSDNRLMDVWSVGKWFEDEKGRRYEVYYLQALSFE